MKWNAHLKTTISPGHELCTAQPVNAAREHTAREFPTVNTARELAREFPTLNAAREYTARELACEFHKLFSPSM